MATVTSKRSIMTLYSNPTDIYSHQTRIVLAEKGVTVEIINVDANHQPEDLFDLNPYGTIPTLVDRDLVLYESRIIMEYLDERFPHPPLLPVYPVARAECRRMMFRIERDWYSLVKLILTGAKAEADKARKELAETFIALTPVFANKNYFLSDDFTLVDCCLAPMIWRFPVFGIEIPKTSKAIYDYAARVFKRESFRTSLTDQEHEMRPKE